MTLFWWEGKEGDERAKNTGYYKCQKSPKKVVFRRGLACSDGGCSHGATPDSNTVMCFLLRQDLSSNASVANSFPTCELRSVIPLSQNGSKMFSNFCDEFTLRIRRNIYYSY